MGCAQPPHTNVAQPSKLCIQRVVCRRPLASSCGCTLFQHALQATHDCRAARSHSPRSASALRSHDQSPPLPRALPPRVTTRALLSATHRPLLCASIPSLLSLLPARLPRSSWPTCTAGGCAPFGGQDGTSSTLWSSSFPSSPWPELCRYTQTRIDRKPTYQKYSDRSSLRLPVAQVLSLKAESPALPLCAIDPASLASLLTGDRTCACDHVFYSVGPHASSPHTLRPHRDLSRCSRCSAHSASSGSSNALRRSIRSSSPCCARSRE